MRAFRLFAAAIVVGISLPALADPPTLQIQQQATLDAAGVVVTVVANCDAGEQAARDELASRGAGAGRRSESCPWMRPARTCATVGMGSLCQKASAYFRYISSEATITRASTVIFRVPGTNEPASAAECCE